MSLQHDPLSKADAGLDPGSQSRMRVGCLLVPDLPLRAELRANPGLAEHPFIVATGNDARAEVLQVSPAAFALGVRQQGSVTHARAVCGELIVRVVSPALERAARQTLLDVALSFSPRALAAERSNWAFTNEAAVFLDASGITRLFDSERQFASAIGARAEGLGLPAIVTLASSRNVAWIAARQGANHQRETGEEHQGSTLLVVPPGAEARLLGPLPIDLLDPDDALAGQLTRFGVRTVNDLLGLPRRALAQRLGPNVLELVALARGEEIESPLPAPKDHRLEEAIDLDYPVDRQEPLQFVLRGLLSRLMDRLAVRHLACGPIDLHLSLASGGQDVRRIGVAAPTRDVRVLLRLTMLALETRPPLAPVETVALSTQGQPARRDQLDLFRPNGPDPNVLDRTLSELESLCGAGRVGAPEVTDDHRPDAFGIKPFSPSASSTSSSAYARTHSQAHPSSSARTRTHSQAHPSSSSAHTRTHSEAHPSSSSAHTRTHSQTHASSSSAHARTHSEAHASSSREGVLAVRALRPPVTAEVRVARGLPISIRSGVANGQILRAGGPWRTTGRWWSETERYALDHYDVQVSDGTVLRLCFDWLEKSWRVDGIYD